MSGLNIGLSYRFRNGIAICEFLLLGDKARCIVGQRQGNCVDLVPCVFSFWTASNEPLEDYYVHINIKNADVGLGGLPVSYIIF